MGQKSNPVSLRLQYTNRHYDASWFSDSFYGVLVLKDFMYQQYFRLFSKLLKIPQARSGFRYYPKKTLGYLFYCYPKVSREWNSKFFGIFSKSRTHYVHHQGAFQRDIKKTRFYKRKTTIFSRAISWLYHRKSTVDLFKKRGSLPLLQEKNLFSHFVFSRFLLNKNNPVLFLTKLNKDFILLKNKKGHVLKYSILKQTESSLKKNELLIHRLKESVSFVLKSSILKQLEEPQEKTILSFYSSLLVYNQKKHDFLNSKDFRNQGNFSKSSGKYNLSYRPCFKTEYFKTNGFFLEKISYLKYLLFLATLRHQNSQNKDLLLKDLIFDCLHGLELQNFSDFSKSSNKKNLFLNKKQIQGHSGFLLKTQRKQDTSKSLNPSKGERVNTAPSSFYKKGITSLIRTDDIFYQEINRNSKKTLLESSGSFSSLSKPAFFSLDSKYQTYFQSFFSHFFGNETQIISFFLKNEWQHAGYLADEIIFFLEKRIPFRRIKMKLIKQLAQVDRIQGLRIVCSGRVGGKSKKAQRAKVESMKYGETSLHVFSSQIDFAARTALTGFGSVGIKVWICYK